MNILDNEVKTIVYMLAAFTATKITENLERKYNYDTKIPTFM